MLHSVELAYTSSGPGSAVIVIIMKEHTGKEGSGMSALWTGQCLDGDLKDKTRLGS